MPIQETSAGSRIYRNNVLTTAIVFGKHAFGELCAKSCLVGCGCSSCTVISGLTASCFLLEVTSPWLEEFNRAIGI